MEATAPVVTEPGQAAPVVAPSLDAIRTERVEAQTKAAQEAAAKAEADKAAEVAAKAVADAQAQAKAKEDADYKAKLDQANAALKQHQDQVTPKLALAEKLEQFQKLASEGKYFEAISALDPDVMTKAVAQVTGMSKEDQEKLTKKGVDPELVQKLENQAQELKKLQDTIKARDEAEAARNKAQGEANVIQYVKDKASEFKFLSKKEEWVKAALVSADQAYAKALEGLNAGKDPSEHQDLDQEAKNKLISDALAAEEAKHAEIAKLYTGSGTEPAKDTVKPGSEPVTAVPVPNKTTGVTQTSNGTSINPSFTGNRASPKPVVAKGKTLDELKAARRAAAN